MQVKGRSGNIFSSLSLCQRKRMPALLSFIYGVLEATIIGGGIGFVAAYGFADEPANFFEYPLVASISGAVVAALTQSAKTSRRLTYERHHRQTLHR